MEKTVALEMQGISKIFGRIIANDKVDMKLYKGEILAVLGENGSGKTTLMNTVAGIYFPDEGRILVDGKEVSISSPKVAFDHKIGMIHQHFKLVDIFTAAENIVLGIDSKEKFNMKKVNRRVSEIADRYGFHIDPKKKVYEMSVSEKQTVEIIKVLYRGADILILDEPTAVLTPQETEKLFAVLRKMREDGKSVVIITHKLHEVLSISDRVTVLRKGHHIATVKTADTNESELTEMMVGKKVSLDIDRSDVVNRRVRLSIRDISVANDEGEQVLDDISFDVFGGEILGIAGIAGSGQRELLESIAGLHNLTQGDIVFYNPKRDMPVTFFHKSISRVRELEKQGFLHYPDGTPVSFDGLTNYEIRKLVNDGNVLFNDDEPITLKDKTPLQIRELGVRLSFVPEDRLGMGLVGSMDLTDNMMLRSYRKGPKLFLDRTKPEALATEVVENLEVVTPGVHTPIRRLSGGNIQKVLVGREIAMAPKVFMAAYPVRGLDINSSYMIYNLLNGQKKKGVAVIFVGEDLDVLLGLCDRILVINSGRITGLVDARTASKEEIGYLMTKTDSAKTDGGESSE